jgi:two-component system cell cycle response regulator
MLLPGCGADSGRVIAERVRRRIEAVPTLYGALALSVTASFGLASTKLSGTEPSSLIEAADSALYRAKSNGRNRVEEYAAPPVEPAPSVGTDSMRSSDIRS